MTVPRDPLLLGDFHIKYGAKVLGKLCDSRTTYIVSVTFVQRAASCSVTVKICENTLIKFIKRPLVVISGHNSNTHSSNMTALNKIFLA